MAQDRVETEVYRDVEKFYKVLGYYDGQELKPIASLEAHVDRSLETSLRNDAVYIRRLQYLLFMTEAQCEGRSVFQTDRPENALTYALFSEGIQALAVLRDLGSVDLREWCELVRKTLVDFDDGKSDKDLASVLWRSPSRNIRCKIYNALLDLETTQDEEEPEEEKPAKKARPNWHHRDQEWDTPDGDRVERKIVARTLNVEAVTSAKSQLLSMGMNPMLPDEFKIGRKELDLLSEELSAFDQNHVDFNLLHWYLRALGSSTMQTSPVKKMTEDLLKALSQSVISRFHPGLIFLLLGAIRNLDPQTFKGLQADLENTITTTLRKPANEKRLLASLRHPERAELTKKLLPYLDPKQFTSVIHFYIGTQDRDGLTHFLKVIIEKHSDSISHMLFGWGEDLLCEVFPSLKGLNWSTRNDFILRALRSTSPKIQREAAKLIAEVSLPPDQTAKIFENAGDETREVWLQSLLDSPPADKWRSFVVRSVESGLWQGASNQMMRGKLNLLWLKVASHYLGMNSWIPFTEWIQKRRFWLWPAFPELREAILNHFLLIKVVRGNREFQNLCATETKLRFQSEDLKHQLMVAAGTK